MSKRNKPKPAAKTLRDKRKAKEARRAKGQGQSTDQWNQGPGPDL